MSLFLVKVGIRITNSVSMLLLFLFLSSIIIIIIIIITIIPCYTKTLNARASSYIPKRLEQKNQPSKEKK